MFLEPLSQKQIGLLKNLTNWFLWSNETTFNSSKMYNCKMSSARLFASKQQGGVGLWDWSQRSEAFAAKTSGWMKNNNYQPIRLLLERSTSKLAKTCRSIVASPPDPKLTIKDITVILFGTQPPAPLTDIDPNFHCLCLLGSLDLEKQAKTWECISSSPFPQHSPIGAGSLPQPIAPQYCSHMPISIPIWPFHSPQKTYI